MKLTELNCKCLLNMPMLVDVIATTINELDAHFCECYNHYCAFLEKRIVSDKKDGFELTKSNEGTTSFFGNSIPLKKDFHLSYDISLTQTKKTAPSSFSVVFGYLIDDTQNSIYFQLFFSEESDCEEFKNKINQNNIPSNLRYGSDDISVWVEFTPDENTSIEKIEQCSNIFKEQILIPYISKFE